MNDTCLKLIRVNDATSNAMFGNILVVTKHTGDAEIESFSVRAMPLVSGAQTAMFDKLTINRIEATVNHKDKIINLGPHQGVEFEPSLRNRGIGAFVFSELIGELREVAGDYKFAPYQASMEGMENQELTEAFLQRFNIQIQYGLEQMIYVLEFPTPNEIPLYHNNYKITEIEVEEYIYYLINNQRLQRTSTLPTSRSEENTAANAGAGEEADKFFGLETKKVVRITIGVCIVLVLIILFLIS